MKQIALVFLVLSGIYVFSSCSSNEATKQTGSDVGSMTPPDSGTAQPNQPAKPSSPAAIAQNAARVEAVIEKVTNIDNVQFSAGIFIVKSEPVKGRISILEPQQRITVYPEFVLKSGTGGLDTSSVKNKKLMSLRSAGVGQSLKAVISIDQQGLWKIVEIED